MSLIKQLAFNVFVRLGLTRVVAWRNRKKIVVLAYHDVYAGDPDPVLNFDHFRVRVENFVRQIQYVATHYQVVVLDDLLNPREGVSPGKPRAAITFDDGYRGLFEHAYPVLQRFAVPATVFVITDFLQARGSLWWDRVRAIVAGARCASIRVNMLGTERLLRLATVRDKQQALRQLAPELRALSPAQRDGILNHLAATLGIEETPHTMAESLSLDELRAMVHDGISIGSHTCAHPSLLHLGEEALLAELGESKRFLESVTAHPVDWLAYPYGDFSNTTIEAARRAGYRGAVATIDGLNDDLTNPFVVRRIDVNDGVTLAQFIVAVSGLRGVLKSLLGLEWLRRWRERGLWRVAPPVDVRL